MEFSDQALTGENNQSHPAGEEELRILNKQIREETDELRSLNQDLVDREARLRFPSKREGWASGFGMRPARPYPGLVATAEGDFRVIRGC